VITLGLDYYSDFFDVIQTQMAIECTPYDIYELCYFSYPQMASNGILPQLLPWIATGDENNIQNTSLKEGNERPHFMPQ
jgi:hypothetical protein